MYSILEIIFLNEKTKQDVFFNYYLIYGVLETIWYLAAGSKSLSDLCDGGIMP